MELVDMLLQVRPTLSVVPTRHIHPDLVRGRIPEILVGEWLSKAPSVEMESEGVINGYRISRRESGYLVSDGSSTAEYDFLFRCNGAPVAAEVKAQRLNGYAGKIPRLLDMAQSIYQRPVPLLLFMPLYHDQKRREAHDIESRFPMVRCVDIGYRKKELNATIRKMV